MTKKKPDQVMSAASMRAVDNFDDAAQHWGWEKDQGTGTGVDAAKDTYEKCRRALNKRIMYLERELKQARAKVRELNPYRASVTFTGRTAWPSAGPVSE